jgi:serine/threonine-protein kinase
MPTVPSARAPGTVIVVSAWLRENAKVVGGAAAAALALLLFVILPIGSSEGHLVINVAGDEGQGVDGVKVYLDDKLVCEDSPCQLKDIEAMGHVVMAEAEGYNSTAAMAVLVKGGETTIHDIKLVSSVTGTGFALPESPGDLTLFVDGKKIGPLPQRLDDLTPGKHTLRATGGDRFEDWEQTIELERGQIKALEPIKLAVRKGIARISAGDNAADADVMLDGKPIKLPFNSELDGKKPHMLTASADGFKPFEKEFSFEPGESSLSLEINLVVDEAAELSEEQDDEPDTTSTRTPTTRSGSAGLKSSSKRSSNTNKSSASGSGKLTLLSVPPVVVILDGRPIGKTPKRALSVSAGTHTAVFVHPTKGRKRQVANVAAGASKTLAVRF